MSAPITVEINGSIALKLTKIAEGSFPNIETGPIFGFDYSEEEGDDDEEEEKKSIVINVSHLFPFPVNNNDDIFYLRGYNVKYQNDIQSKLRETRAGAKLLGWFISTTNGKFLSQSIVDSMVHLQENNKRENKDETPIVYLVYDPSKSLDGVLSLKAYKLSEPFLKTYYSEQKFIPKNLIENKLSYKNIFEEVPITLKNTFLTNLKIQELESQEVDESLQVSTLALSSNYLSTINTTAEQLSDSIDSLNHNLGNLNYFQRNLSREMTKINQFKSKAKQEGKNPNDWRKQFKLPNVPSKLENLVISGLIQNYCIDLENNVALEQAKVGGVKKALDL